MPIGANIFLVIKGREKKREMDGGMRQGIHGVQKYVVATTYTSSTRRRENSNHVHSSFEDSIKCCFGQRQGKATTDVLLLQGIVRAKSRYEPLEKFSLAIVTTIRRLKPYLQAHLVEIQTNFPLLQILHKPTITRRVMKWAIKLSEFNIKFILATTFKA